MIGNGGDEAVDFFVIQEILVAACGGDFLADNFLGESVAAVVEVASGNAFDAGQLNGIAEQAGTLHADADDAETETVARRRGLHRQRDVLRLQKNRRRSREGAGSAMEKLTAGKIFFHGALLERVNSFQLTIRRKELEQDRSTPFS